MSGLIANGDYRAELARRARLRAAQHYTWDAITTQYEKLFEELLGGSRNAVRKSL
jgi:glycosyltransferase involved in cell wall biosynthesis